MQVQRGSFAELGTGVLVAGRLHKPGPSWLERRVLDVHAVVLLTAGAGAWEGPGGRQAITAGDLLLLVPERWHSYGPGVGQSWQESFLVMHGPLWQHLCRPGAGLPAEGGVIAGLPGSLVRRFVALVERCRSQPRDDPRHEAELHLLLVEAMAAGRRPGWVAQACRRLAEDPADRIDLAALAAEFALSPDRFRRAFRRATGLAPAAWRMQQRLALARDRLLAEPGLGLAVLAEELGFCDAFEFSKVFKRHSGCSPRAFRRGW